MGIFNYMFDNEWLQRADIEATRNAVHAQARIGIRSRGEMRREMKGLEARVAELEEENGVLALFVRTLQRLMIEKGVFNKDELAAALRAIDLQDGKADGKYTRRVSE